MRSVASVTRLGSLSLPLFVLLLLPAGRAGADAASEAISACLDCHEDEESTMAFGDGSTRSIHLDLATFRESVHGKRLVCTDCHEKYDVEHPKQRAFKNQRDLVLSSYEMCKRCHFDTYTRTLESVHYEQVRQGSAKAPVCTDCHGAHDISSPRSKRTMMAKSCARCHTEVYEKYSRSVHGKALVEDDNPDTPACADCHTHHSIEPPDTLRFRLSSPDMCVRCHGDPKRMTRYGIPTDVATTYLADFHGVTASLSKDSPTGQVVVTCIDCHGVHDIAAPAALGAEAMSARVASTCQQCHKEADQAFPASWLSHYRPSLSHAPLVFLVDLSYRIIIPFIVAGLVLQVLLHLYRVAIRR